MSYAFNPFTGNFDLVGSDGVDGADGEGVVTGGTTGQVLAKASNTDYDTEWVDQTGGGGTPGGVDTQIQFNDGGAFGGDPGLTYDKTTGKATLGGDLELDNGGTFDTTVQQVTPTANRIVSIPDATGTIGLVNGPNGSIQFNQLGALRGTTDFSVQLDWNNAATIFTGLKLNVTDTASAAGSKLLDLQRNGTSAVTISTSGAGTGYLKLIPTTVSALTAAATVGAGTRAFVTDSVNTLASHHGDVVIGGGSNFTPVYSDGIDWRLG